MSATLVWRAVLVSLLWTPCLAAQAGGAPSSTTTCNLEDGRQVYVRYNPVAAGKEKPANGKPWSPGGAPMTLFTEAQFFLHDVGVVVLSKAVKLNAAQYGRLPAVDQLESLHPGSATTFTSVGYGLQRINPAQVEAEKIRMFAQPHLIQIDTGFTGSFSLLLSNNALEELTKDTF